MDSLELNVRQQVFATGLLLLTIFFNAFPSVPYLNLGRTTATLVLAILFIYLDITPSEEAWRDVDWNTIAFLFGMMAIKVILQSHGIAYYFKNLLLLKSPSQVDLLIRISLLSAILSIFITNDGACVFMTSVVDEIGDIPEDFTIYNNLTSKQQTKKLYKRKYHLFPLLLAICSSANIGSAAVLTGNPQNVLVGQFSGISFYKFALLSFPPAIFGLILNILFLRTYSIMGWFKDESKFEQLNELPTEDEESGENIKTEIQNGNSSNLAIEYSTDFSLNTFFHKKENYIYVGIVFVLCLMLFQFFVVTSISHGWITAGMAVALMVLDQLVFVPFLQKYESKEDVTTRVYHKLEWSILVWFASMFIIMVGFGRTHLTRDFWTKILRFSEDSTYTEFSEILLLSVTIETFSNVVGNVPLILLVAPNLSSKKENTFAWVIIAWVSTIAGNLTLVGSAANVIVAELNQTKQLTFVKHIFFGLPTTIIISAMGVVFIWGLSTVIL